MQKNFPNLPKTSRSNSLNSVNSLNIKQPQLIVQHVIQNDYQTQNIIKNDLHHQMKPSTPYFEFKTYKKFDYYNHLNRENSNSNSEKDTSNQIKMTIPQQSFQPHQLQQSNNVMIKPHKQ